MTIRISRYTIEFPGPSEKRAKNWKEDEMSFTITSISPIMKNSWQGDMSDLWKRTFVVDSWPSFAFHFFVYRLHTHTHTHMYRWMNGENTTILGIQWRNFKNWNSTDRSSNHYIRRDAFVGLILHSSLCQFRHQGCYNYLSSSFCTSFSLLLSQLCPSFVQLSTPFHRNCISRVASPL